MGQEAANTHNEEPSGGGSRVATESSVCNGRKRGSRICGYVAGNRKASSALSSFAVDSETKVEALNTTRLSGIWGGRRRPRSSATAADSAAMGSSIYRSRSTHARTVSRLCERNQVRSSWTLACWALKSW